MRTTLNLPDALGREAKARAAHEGRTFTIFIADALREHLSRDASNLSPEPLPVYEPAIPGTIVDLDDKDALWNALDQSA